MDILIRGMLPQEKKYVATCSNCGTKVLYRLKEVKVTHYQREGTSHEYDCPLCLQKVYTAPCPMGEPAYTKHPGEPY